MILIDPNIGQYLATVGKTPQGVRELDSKEIVAQLAKQKVFVSEESVCSAQSMAASTLEQAASDSERLHKTVARLKKGQLI